MPSSFSTSSSHNSSHESSVLADEIRHFSTLAKEWWDPKGPMAPLHAMNPLRTSWIRNKIPKKFFENGQKPTLLDIGCGAGLASESFAKLGFNTLGVDASKEAIDAAQEHSQRLPLPHHAAPLNYLCGNAEALIHENKKFDIVCALEVIEHVRDPNDFMSLLSSLVKPGGFIVVSTMNRTLRSYLMAKLGAEYILRLLPIGTHDWNKFIKPTDLTTMGRECSLRLTHLSGMSFTPPYWKETKDTSINYIALFAALKSERRHNGASQNALPQRPYESRTIKAKVVGLPTGVK